MKKYHFMSSLLAITLVFCAPLRAADLSSPSFVAEQLLLEPSRAANQLGFWLQSKVTGPKQSPLHEAIMRDNDQNQIERLVREGKVDVNKAYGNASEWYDVESRWIEHYPLITAIEWAKPNAVRALIAAGANLNDPYLLYKAKSRLDRVRHLKDASAVAVYNQIISDLKQAGAPEAPRFTQRQKVTLAALTAAVVGIIGIKLRSYQNTKKKLVRKYKLGNLTLLQDKIWLATLLASYRMPWRLRILVRNNEGSLEDFVGKNPLAIAELYYGHKPNKKELNAFIERFFSTAQ